MEHYDYMDAQPTPGPIEISFFFSFLSIRMQVVDPGHRSMCNTRTRILYFAADNVWLLQKCSNKSTVPESYFIIVLYMQLDTNKGQAISAQLEKSYYLLEGIHSSYYSSPRDLKGRLMKIFGFSASFRIEKLQTCMGAHRWRIQSRENS